MRFKIAAILTLLFTVCIGLIRAQPYDDSQLRAFLTPPEGCPMPCFMGIRPGVTSFDDAKAIIERHAWTGNEVVVHRLDTLLWNWSGLQPQWIEGQYRRGSLGRNINTNLVGGILIGTHIRFGDMWLLLGKPDELHFYLLQTDARMYDAFFSSASVMVTIYPHLCTTLADFWSMYSDVVFTSEYEPRLSGTAIHPGESLWLKELLDC
jgi:hypothetical protein